MLFTLSKRIVLSVVAVILIVGGLYYFEKNNSRPATAPVIETGPGKETQGAPAPAPQNQNKANVLDLSNRGLEKLSQDIFNQTGLTELNVSGNRLTGALPAEIRKLKNLKKIDASNNPMTGIPAEIGQLSELEELNYANNKITGLPLEIGNLKKLKIFNLTGNDYSAYDLGLIKKLLPNLRVIGEK